MLRSVAGSEIPDVSGRSWCLRLRESSSSILVTTARLLSAKAPRYSETSGITPSQSKILQSFATPLRETRTGIIIYLTPASLRFKDISTTVSLYLFIPLLYLLIEQPCSSGEHFWYTFGRCPVRVSATTVTS